LNAQIIDVPTITLLLVSTTTGSAFYSTYKLLSVWLGEIPSISPLIHSYATAFPSLLLFLIYVELVAMYT